MNRDVCAICWCPYGDEGECGCKSVRVTDHFGDSNKMASEALREDVQRFREAANCERETRRQLERHNELLEASLKEARTLMEGYAEVKAKDEALLRQALEALEYCRSGEDCHPTPTSEAIDAIKERLK